MRRKEFIVHVGTKQSLLIRDEESKLPRFIFHLGYPKTGTTYLQRKIFSQLVDYYAVVTPEFENLGVTIQRLKMQIQTCSLPGGFSAKLAERSLLLSIEGLLFDPIRQFHEQANCRPSFSTALNGLREITLQAPDHQIAIVLYLRAQPELVHSLYAESKTYFFDAVDGLNTLDDYANAVMSRATGPEDAGWYLDFNKTISEIRVVFPDAALHVRFYESLSDYPEDEVVFWSQLTETPLKYMSGRENARAQSEGIKIADPRSLHLPIFKLKKLIAPNLKVPNRLKFKIRDFLRAIGRGESPVITMPESTRERLATYFAQMNVSLVASGVSIPDYLLPFYVGEDYCIEQGDTV